MYAELAICVEGFCLAFLEEDKIKQTLSFIKQSMCVVKTVTKTTYQVWAWIARRSLALFHTMQNNFVSLVLKGKKQTDCDLSATSCGTYNGTCCWCSSTVGPYHFLSLQSHQASCIWQTDINPFRLTLFCSVDFGNWNSTQHALSW